MAIHRTSRSGLFLLELMIVILFFAVTSAVCVNLFVQAHLTSTAGSELTAATREVQSVAEMLKAADGNLEQLATQLEGESGDGRLDLYFDSNWNRIGAQDAAYTITVLCGSQRLKLPDGSEISPAETDRADYVSAVVAAWSEAGEIFQVPVEKYLG
ncbi:MAG: hypothetical protein PHE47_05015 [Oscillospiraceae bacterium]|nr:hypothetical protein [Oscillospiraceae bacterium]